MSSSTPPAAPPLKKGRKPEKSEMMADPVPTTNEELRTKLMDVQIELQQERSKVRWRRKKCNPLYLKEVEERSNGYFR